MINIAKKKFQNAKFITADFDNIKLNKKFDLIIIFNAFPHFENKTKTIRKAKSLLKKDAKLIIAHSFRLDEINKIHKKTKNKTIEKHIITVKEIKDIFKKLKFQDIYCNNKKFFYIEGRR